ncbi:MAG: rhomboid family intramembrane serine protease, partial [Phycisphaerales bacterium]|nr:rhomboid family intramembrane serine protease [Phycisphaerales bacterium]
LWAFGPNVEDRFGRLRYLAFYLAGGAASGGLHALFSPNPALGASGAISGVTGAFLVLYPFVGVKCFNLLYMAVMWLPAWWLVGFALVWDLIMQGSGARTGTAHLAHLGGYAWGIGLCVSLIGLKLMDRRPYDLFTWGRQVHRRRQISSAVRESHRQQARRFEQIAKDPELARQTEQLAAARAVVTAHLAKGEGADARRAYRALADRYDHLPGATVLPRRQQFEIAAHFQQAGDAAGAAHAFARFLEGYPRDPESPQVRLLLGVIHARSLNDPLKAKALIREAIAGGLDEPGREMAQRELEALG